MSVVIHEHSARVRAPDGTVYTARTVGTERADGTWAGMIEFSTLTEGRQVFCTGQETSQPGRRALEYWAAGIEPVYLEGALVRAQRAAHRVR